MMVSFCWLNLKGMSGLLLALFRCCEERARARVRPSSQPTFFELEGSFLNKAQARGPAAAQRSAKPAALRVDPASAEASHRAVLVRPAGRGDRRKREAGRSIYHLEGVARSAGRDGHGAGLDGGAAATGSARGRRPQRGAEQKGRHLARHLFVGRFWQRRKFVTKNPVAGVGGQLGRRRGRRADGRTWARGERVGRTLDGGKLSKCQRDSINRFPWSRWWLLAKWVPLIGRSGDCRVGIHLAKMVDGHLCTFYRPRLESNKNGRLSGTAAAYVSAAEGLEGQVQFGHTKDGTLSQNH